MLDFRELPIPTLAGPPAEVDPSRNGRMDRRSGHSSEESPILRTTRLADVQAETVRWLWEPRFSSGMVSLLAGDPGVAKTTRLLDIAARVSAGVAWPDRRDAPNDSAEVLIFTAEDSVKHVITAESVFVWRIVPRLPPY